MALSSVLFNTVRSRPGVRVEVSDLTYIELSGEPALLLNLSEAGMAVRTSRKLQPAELLEFNFTLPHNDVEVRGAAAVVWSDRTGRAGLKFMDLTARDRMQLQLWLRQKEQSLALTQPPAW